MIYEYVISFALAFIVAFSFTPVAKKISFKLGAIDVPDDPRRIHKKPTARLGGLSIFIGFMVSLTFGIACTYINKTGIIPSKQLIGLLMGAVIIVAVGIIDDVKQLGPKIKLFFQIIATVIVIIISGTRIVNLTNPFIEGGTTQLSNYISYPLTVLWIVGVTNAINLIDGLDGLAAGVSSISYLSLFFVALITGDPESALITIILAGSTLGFLPYNFNPAKIFMGDTGSTFLGFTLSIVSIQGMLKFYAALSIAIPLLVLGLPLFDILSTVVRRLLKRKPIMQGDRGHLHHRLMDMGYSHKQAVLVMYTLSATLGLSAIVLADRGFVSAIILVITVAIFVIGGAKYMLENDEIEFIEEDKKETETVNPVIGKQGHGKLDIHGKRN